MNEKDIGILTTHDQLSLRELQKNLIQSLVH